MGKPDRYSSAIHLQSLWDTSTKLNSNIPEIFRSQSREAASSAHAAWSSRAVSRSPTRSPSTQPSESQTLAAKTISLEDLRAVARDIKETISAAISDLHLDMQAVATRLEEVEEITDCHDTTIHKVQQTLDAHTVQLRDLHRHLDLDNRGHLQNIRIRGLPETIEPGNLSPSHPSHI